jgi:hypothetical protein
MVSKCAQITSTTELHTVLNLLLQQLVSHTIFTWKTYILQQGFKVNSLYTHVRKTADEVRITISFRSFGVKKINK